MNLSDWNDATIDEKRKICLTEISVFDEVINPVRDYIRTEDLYREIGGQIHEWYRIRNNLRIYTTERNSNTTLMWQSYVMLGRTNRLLKYIINPGIRAMLRYEGRLKEI